MLVTDWKINEHGDAVEVSADVDGFRLWYRTPKAYQVSKTGDAFLVSTLLPAMRQGEELEIDPNLPISPKLLRNVYQLQEIFHSWNPRELKIIPIKATTSPAQSLNPGVMSFFSGGVDSTYTLLKRATEISHVVFMLGFDFYAHGGGGSAFSVADLSDLSQFSYNLIKASNPVYAFLKATLSETTLQAMSNYLVSGRDPMKLESALVKDLGEIIAGKLIYEPKRFCGVNLRPETKQLLAQGPDGEALLRLNRMLLEDACIEIAQEHCGTIQAAIDRNTKFVQSFGKTLVPVYHNHYAFGYRYNLSRNLTQGSVLASVGLLLGFPRVYVPSAFSFGQLVPLGSHPLTDPLWTNECVDVRHDGAEATRIDKLQKICKSESALANLRVCLNEMNVNCGMCAKCLRTMISLRLLGASAAPFPPLPRPKAIRKSQISDDIEMAFFKESLEFAAHSEDQNFRNDLCVCLRRNERRRLLAEFDRLFLGGIIKQTSRQFVNDRPRIRRIDTTPPKV
jgi:hypothetical protein